MQLNRSSSIVRWYLFANLYHSEEAKQKALAEVTNLCAFVQRLFWASCFWAILGTLLIATVAVTWFISALVAVGAALFAGIIPMGWKPNGDWLLRYWLPGTEWRWERKLHVTIRGRTISPDVVWGWALIACTVVGVPALLIVWVREFIVMEREGWMRANIPTMWYVLHGAAFAVALFVAVACTRTQWQSTDTWRVVQAWWQAKKDRVCPRIEFTE